MSAVVCGCVGASFAGSVGCAIVQQIDVCQEACHRQQCRVSCQLQSTLAHDGHCAAPTACLFAHKPPLATTGRKQHNYRLAVGTLPVLLPLPPLRCRGAPAGNTWVGVRGFESPRRRVRLTPPSLSTTTRVSSRTSAGDELWDLNGGGTRPVAATMPPSPLPLPVPLSLPPPDTTAGPAKSE